MLPHTWKLFERAMLAMGAAAALAQTVRAEPNGTNVTVRTVSQEGLFGELLSLAPEDGALIRTSAGEQFVPFQDLVRVTVATAAPHRGDREYTLALTSGDMLFGKFAEARTDAVVFETADVGRVAVALESVAGVDAPAASQPPYKSSVEWFDRARTSSEDRILLTNGDTVNGFITSIDAEGIRIQSALGDTSVPMRRVLAIRLAGSRSPSPPGLHLVIRFRSGGRLTVADLRWSDQGVEARLAGGENIRTEPERIAQLEVRGGRWEWLSQQAPVSFEHIPMLSLPWEYAGDRNVLGGPITVNGEMFEHGIGVHSQSHLTYDLRAAYTEFVTSFGLDDNSGPLADVSVAILGDGQRRFELLHVRPGALHGPIRLDVTNVNRLELIVGFGDNGDIQDRFNWVEPALIR